jgi:hypothetical protein
MMMIMMMMMMTVPTRKIKANTDKMNAQLLNLDLFFLLVVGCAHHKSLNGQFFGKD